MTHLQLLSEHSININITNTENIKVFRNKYHVYDHLMSLTVSDQNSENVIQLLAD